MCSVFYINFQYILVYVWYLNVLEHVGVVADLSQLHDSVHQGLRTSFTLENLKEK